MNEPTKIRMTSFKLSAHLHTQLKMMCVLTHKSMGEFIRVAIADKIRDMKKQELSE